MRVCVGACVRLGGWVGVGVIADSDQTHHDDEHRDAVSVY